MSIVQGAHDPELRSLLDSLGITPLDRSELTDPGLKARAEQTLARIIREPRVDSRSRSVRLLGFPRLLHGRSLAAIVAGAVAVAVVLVFTVVDPFTRSHVAEAQTPAMLHFAAVKDGAIPGAGEPAQAVLEDLSARALQLPPPADLPVQRLQMSGWSASASADETGEIVETVVRPVRSNSYIFPNGDRRDIGRIGEMLDQDGRIVDSDEFVKTLSYDTTFHLDPEHGADYPRTLPADPAALREALAPSADCVSAPGYCLLVGVQDLFQAYVIDPTLTSRIWALLATDPDITTLGLTEDRAGRKAVAVTATSDRYHEQLIVLLDAKTGAYLGSEQILVGKSTAYSFDPPAVVGFATLLSAKRIAESDVPDDSTTTWPLGR